MFNGRQFNTTPLNTGLISANVSAKSTVSIVSTANILAKSTVNVISSANTILKSTVNVGLEVNVLAKSTVTVNANANVSLNSLVSINYNPLPSLYVFSSSEQLQAILINNGSACPFFAAEHDEKINLENTLTFQIPSNHADAQYVVEGSLIGFQDLDYNWQLFEVTRTYDIDQTDSIREVYCDHAFYELLGNIVPSGGGTSTSAWLAITSALSQSRWEVGTIVDLGLGTTNFSYQTALACLQQVATTWKGELQFRIIIVNGLITHRYVDLIAQRGNGITGKQFVFGKDLTKVEREVDFTNLCTAMYGRGKASSTGVRLNFASINAGKEYVADAVALAKYGLAGGTRHRFGIFDDPQETSQANLLSNTTASLQLSKTPTVNYQFQVVSLEQVSPAYAHEIVRIGDTALAIDDNLVPPLQIQVRVIQLKRNLLEYDKTQITLGNFKPDLAYTQNIQAKINQKVANNSGIWDNASALVPSVLDATVFDLTAQLRAAGGYVYFSPTDGIMVYDTPDPATATKVMKLGAGIFGLASSKTNGVWNWRTFGTGAGFTADEITAGKISADKVQIGTGAQVLGSSTFYWDTSGLYAINGLNVVKITSTGISIGTSGINGAFSTIITGAGTAQADTIQIADNVDSTHNLKLKFYIDDNVTLIKKVNLAFSLEKFRAYETGASSGGSSVPASSILATALQQTDYAYTYGGSESHAHNENIPGHSHTVNIPNHTHNLIYGIFESSVATGVNVIVDGIMQISSGFTTDQKMIALETWITTSGWHTVELTSTILGRINASLYVKSYVGI